MKNHLKSLAVAAMLVWWVPIWASPQAGVQNEISQVLTDSENQDKDTLSFWEEKVRLQIEEKMNEFIKDKKLEKLVKFYWEDWVKSRIYEMIDEVYKNSDKYWTFDSKWNFTLNDDFFGDMWNSLFRSKFSEYELRNLDRDAGVCAAVLGFLGISWIIGGLFLAKKMVGYKEYSEKLEEENKRLRGQIKELEKWE